MKATELMIGDWVKHPKGQNRITMIQDNDEVFTDYAEDIRGAFEVDNVEPIPLTKQMLETNGFKYEPNSEEKDDGWWCWKRLGIKDGNEYISIAFRGDDVAVYDIELMKGSNSMTLHRNYVHELQHALVLCGFDNDIKLED